VPATGSGEAHLKGAPGKLGSLVWPARDRSAEANSCFSRRFWHDLAFPPLFSRMCPGFEVRMVYVPSTRRVESEH
jgi:hypothetical protein